ncbi:protein SEY1 [Marchantia polymorpha subsp. ruderalis]
MVYQSPSTRGSFKKPSFNPGDELTTSRTCLNDSKEDIIQRKSGKREQQEAAQLIDASGEFHKAAVDKIVRDHLDRSGVSYAVVAIMGAQSSGKSTILNHLFRTSFKEMDAFAGRNQTTQGVWIARAKDIDPCTIVMDLEGTDGQERGEDDTAFEKRSALFALAVSDILLINMWCHDIGREQAANKPLLKTVFQVMMRLFTPRKTTLLFVIRDKTRTPLSVLESSLRGDVQKIWERTPKPPQYEGTQLSQFFTVEVTALANFEEKPELFEEQVGQLRDRFNNSIQPGGLAGDRRGVVPGSGFGISISDIWKIIKENKDLDLPAHKVMVATVRCEEIAHEKLSALLADPDWHDLDEGARKGLVPGFGKRLSALLHRHLSGYDDEAAYFDDNVRRAKRNYLVTKVLDTVQPAYQAVVLKIWNEALNKFMQGVNVWEERPVGEEGFAVAVRRCSEQALSDFDKGCSDSCVSQAHWDNGKLRKKLHRKIDAHAQTVRAEKIAAIVASVQKRVEHALTESARAELAAASEKTWPSVKRLLTRETDIAKAALLSDIAGFEPDETEKATMLDRLTSFSRGVVERQAREEASQALPRMKDRFTTSFSHDAKSQPRLWSEEEYILATAKEARSESHKVLSALAVIQLDYDDMNDPTKPALSSLLDGSSQNALAANSWDGVPQGNTLLSPVECKKIWKQFKDETDSTILQAKLQALAAQAHKKDEAHKKSSSWLPPSWCKASKWRPPPWVVGVGIGVPSAVCLAGFSVVLTMVLGG